MNQLLYLSLDAAIFCTVGLIALVLSTRTSRATLQRIREVTNGSKRFRRTAPRVRESGRRLFASMHWLRAHLGLAEDVSLPDRLIQAGYKGTVAADIYSSARVVCPAIALMVGAFIPFHRLFWVLALPAVAYLAPNFTLTRLVKGRRERIRRSIPDTIDLLVICVDAGLGIDQALLRVSEELAGSHPEITQELLQINREQRAGKPRIQAWADMADRCELPDIDSFSAMLLQTERFGTPIARALSSFAETVRLKRRQSAEEMAAKTTVKIIFPLVLFIFPSMFIVLLGPAALTIARGMGSMGR